MKRSITLVCAAVLALGLAGCSASHPGQKSAGGHPTASSPTPSSSSALPEDQQPPWVSPLTEFTLESEGLNGTPTELAARQKQQFTTMQDKISSCMQQQGFQYTPQAYVAPPPVSSATVDGITDAELSDKNWVAKYGYGIVQTQLRPIGQVDDGSSGGGADTAKKTAPVTPDTTYLNSLSASQQAAYRAAMYGPADNTSSDLATQGCFGKATKAVKGPDLEQESQFEPFFDAAAQFEGTFKTWPGMPKLDADWSSCMAGKGQPGFAHQGDAAQSVEDKYGALMPGGSTSNPPIAQLTTLGTQEVSLALIDLDCRTEVDYWNRYHDIETKADNQFLADHKEEVTAIRAAEAQVGK